MTKVNATKREQIKKDIKVVLSVIIIDCLVYKMQGNEKKERELKNKNQFAFSMGFIIVKPISKHHIIN